MVNTACQRAESIHKRLLDKGEFLGPTAVVRRDRNHAPFITDLGINGYFGNCVKDRRLPSTSLNQATFVLSENTETPKSSWARPGKCTNETFFACNASIIASISVTCQPNAVNRCGWNDFTFWMRRLVPLASNTRAKGSSAIKVRPNVC